MPVPITTSSNDPSSTPSTTPNLTSHTPTTVNPILKSIAQLPGPNLDTDTCALLGPFALAIQALMACIVLGSLLVKRHREKPKRKYRIWTADVSKQVIGQAFVHSLNILISASIASLPSKGNPCALYFMNIFIDTTLGVFILLLILRFLTHLLSVLLRLPPASMGLASGTYPRPFLISWLKQLGLYLLALALLKLTVVAMFYVGGEALIRFGDRVIEAVSPNAKVQVVIVVMVGPTILNVLQFLLIDSFIRHTPAPVHELLESSDEEDEQDGTYRGDSDEEADLDDRDQSDLEADSSERAGLVSERRSKPPSSKPSRHHQKSSSVKADRRVPAAITGIHSYPPRSSITETRERKVAKSIERRLSHDSNPNHSSKVEEGWEDESWARWDEEDGLRLPKKPSSPTELKTGMIMSERNSVGMSNMVVNNSESSW